MVPSSFHKKKRIIFDTFLGIPIQGNSNHYPLFGMEIIRYQDIYANLKPIVKPYGNNYINFDENLKDHLYLKLYFTLILIEDKITKENQNNDKITFLFYIKTPQNVMGIRGNNQLHHRSNIICGPINKNVESEIDHFNVKIKWLTQTNQDKYVRMLVIELYWNCISIDKIYYDFHNYPKSTINKPIYFLSFNIHNTTKIYVGDYETALSNRNQFSGYILDLDLEGFRNNHPKCDINMDKRRPDILNRIKRQNDEETSSPQESIDESDGSNDTSSAFLYQSLSSELMIATEFPLIGCKYL
ncbi:unnamed protein product [Gordionus sp. m RMFG-2023]